MHSFCNLLYKVIPFAPIGVSQDNNENSNSSLKFMNIEIIPAEMIITDTLLHNFKLKFTNFFITLNKGNSYELNEFILAQVVLRAPHEVAFAMHSWPLFLPHFRSYLFFSPSSAFDPLRGNSRVRKWQKI